MGRPDKLRPGDWPDEQSLRPFLFGTRHLLRASNLSDFARVVLALWMMGEEAELIGDLTYIAPQVGSERVRQIHRDSYYYRVAWLIGIVQGSQHPVIRHILRHGFPLGCGVLLPPGRNVVCPNCRARVSVVPCVYCTPTHLEDAHLVPEVRLYDGREEQDVPLAPALESTEARPGTADKIEVMRQRVTAGQSPFHQDDPKIANRIEAGRMYL